MKECNFEVEDGNKLQKLLEIMYSHYVLWIMAGISNAWCVYNKGV